VEIGGAKMECLGLDIIVVDCILYSHLPKFSPILGLFY